MKFVASLPARVEFSGASIPFNLTGVPETEQPDLIGLS